MTWKFNASRNTNTQACRPRPQVRAAGQQRDAWTVGAGTWGEQGEGAGAQGPFRTTCATCFLAHPATAGRAPAADRIARQLVGFGMVQGNVMHG